MAYVLTVDDEIDVLGTLSRALSREGHEVGQAQSAMEGWAKIIERRPDLVVLDIAMPGMDGLSLCQQIRDDRRFVDLPVLFLTAHDKTEDVVAGLDAGADDYVTKPFDLSELNARVRALLRRNIRFTEQPDTLLEVGKLRLDSTTYKAFIAEKEVQLTSTEHKLLRYLMEHANQAISPNRLLEDVWEYPPRTGDPDLVRAHVRNLRYKLGDNAETHLIRTIHGVGYLVTG